MLWAWACDKKDFDQKWGMLHKKSTPKKHFLISSIASVVFEVNLSIIGGGGGILSKPVLLCDVKMGAGTLLMNASVATVDVIIYANSEEKSLNLYLNN